MSLCELSNRNKILIASGALVLAMGIAIWQFKDSIVGDSSSRMDPVVMLCINPQCQKAYRISAAETEKLMEEIGPMSSNSVMPGQQPSFICKYCGQRTAYIAMECKKCKAIFIPKNVSQTNEPADKCPECGYTESAQHAKQQ